MDVESPSQPAELWRHPNPTSTQMYKFLEHVRDKYDFEIKDYPTLHKWSVENISEFWEEVWNFCGIKASKPYCCVLPDNASMFPRPDFFAGTLLNFAENLLFPENADVNESSTAIITVTEVEKQLVSTTWAELREAVRQCSNALRAAGLKPKDVVAGFVSNHHQALVAMLSAAAIGAVQQMANVLTVRRQRLLFKNPDNGVSAVLDRLVQLEPKVLFADNGTVYNGKSWAGTDKISQIVDELKSKALSCGTTLILYSGSPFKPHGYLSLPRLLSSLRATHFGTSAAYLTTLETNSVYPIQSLDLSSLQAIYSTAAPLPPSTFSFVYKAFPAHVNLASITGGTDIISCFGLPCPLLPVHVGEIQCAALGMAIDVVDSISGDPVPDGNGELVCTKPFPSQPLTFWGPGGDSKYRASYFERFDGVWHHGDFLRMNAKTGGIVMLGRSDGVLKPGGVRFGSAEIYNLLTKFFGDKIEDAVCVGRRRETDRDETVCLFVVMIEGNKFTPELQEMIRGVIRKELSPRHVPTVIEECGAGIPKTLNGKKYVFTMSHLI
ncbi:hypothetical protein Daesc_008169 [Daldinia eschscholtzii]|uniref:Acetoacetyl-CoA synthetase n=1 Tax=Daldinia eschscholtzii TaxID=292717 RepID=A0AAX6MBT6_9PEZI